MSPDVLSGLSARSPTRIKLNIGSIFKLPGDAVFGGSFLYRATLVSWILARVLELSGQEGLHGSNNSVSGHTRLGGTLVNKTTTAHEGLCVLDLSTRLSGAFAARLFADFGADVILAEPPGGHALRHEPPLSGADHASPTHAYANWNKRSRTFEHLADLQSDIANADVVITTDLEIAEGIAAWLKPHTVHLCVTAHGNRGEIGQMPGNPLTISARSGWSYINRLRDEPPLQMPRHQSGYVGGVAGYIAAAAALFSREVRRNVRQDERHDSDGPAERVDVSELEAFAHTVHPWGIMSIYARQGDAYGPVGWRPRGAPGPLWEARDGRMHLAIGDFHNWTAAMAVLGLPEIGADPELIPDIGRHGRNLKPVIAAIGDALPKLDRWSVFHDLAQLRCVVGVMQNTADLLEDPQYANREYFTDTEVDGKTVRTAGAPLKLHPAPWRHRHGAPPAGPGSATFTETGAGATGTEPKSPRTTDHSGEGPLAGVRILSFGQAWSGTFGAEVFSLLGADVVQIGSIQRPDVWRRVRNDIPEGVYDPNRRQHPLNTSALYNSVNLNKRELTLNLKDPRGMDLFWRLVPKFDVVLDNFRATVMPGWGVTLEKLNELRPGIIWASISGYGTQGPYSDYPANGASTEPMSGFSSLHGYAGDEGMNTAGLYPDPVSGYWLAMGILTALHHRERTGLPQRVDLAMTEAVTALCGDAIIEHQLSGRAPGPTGNRHPHHAPHNHFACAQDEWLALATETDAQWQALASLVGGALAAPEWRARDYRKANEDQLEAMLGAWCSDQSAHALEGTLCNAGIPAARVMPLYELYTQTDSPLHETGFIQRVEHPEAGPSLLPGYPWHFSAFISASDSASGSSSGGAPLTPSPCVGEHSQQILADELGIDASTYLSLVAAGVTGTLAEHEEHHLKNLQESL